MSGAVYSFTCTRCDFEGSYSSGRGAFVYRSPDGLTVAIPWSTAWCASCGTIRRVQTGFSVATLEAECQRLEQQTSQQKGSLLTRLFHGEDSAAGCRRDLRANPSCLRRSADATHTTRVWSAEAQMCGGYTGEKLTKPRGPCSIRIRAAVDSSWSAPECGLRGKAARLMWSSPSLRLSFEHIPERLEICHHTGSMSALAGAPDPARMGGLQPRSDQHLPAGRLPA